VDADEQTRALERQKLENLIRVRGFADHIKEFRNLTPRVRGLIALADALWKEDEPYARKLLVIAYEAARSSSRTKDGSTDSGGHANSSTENLHWLSREVVVGIARHDAAWAKTLATQEVDSSKSREAYFAMARDLVVDDPRQASQYIEMGLESGASQDIAFLLDALRRKDPGVADQLFLKSLQNLAEQPSADPYQLLMAGYYIFLPDQSALVVVVRGHLIFNFSGVNPLD